MCSNGVARVNRFSCNVKRSGGVLILQRTMVQDDHLSPATERDALRALGERLRDCRLRRNVKQREVAKALGVSLPTYRKLEQGDGTVPTRHLARVLTFFGGIERLADVVPAETERLGQPRLACGRRRARSCRER